MSARQWPGRDALLSHAYTAKLHALYDERVHEAACDAAEQRRLIAEWATHAARELRGLDDDESRWMLALCHAVVRCLSKTQVDLVTDVRVARRFAAIVAGAERAA